MRLPVPVQRTVAHLHFIDAASSARSIARHAGVSRSVVAQVRQAVIETGCSWAQLEALSDEEWQEKLGTQDRSSRKRRPTPDWQYVAREVRHGSTLKAQWVKWKQERPEAAGYTQFTTAFRKWKESSTVLRPAGPTSRSPGTFVGFVDTLVSVGDTGATAHILVAILPSWEFAFLTASTNDSAAELSRFFGLAIDEARLLPAMQGPHKWRNRDGAVADLNELWLDVLRASDPEARMHGGATPGGTDDALVVAWSSGRWLNAHPNLRQCATLHELHKELQLFARSFRAGLAHTRLMRELDRLSRQKDISERFRKLRASTGRSRA